MQMSTQFGRHWPRKAVEVNWALAGQAQVKRRVKHSRLVPMMGQLLECGACGIVISALSTAVRLHNSVVRGTMTEAVTRTLSTGSDL